MSLCCLSPASQTSVYDYFSRPPSQCHFFSRQVNLFFLLNIVRVLITKLKDTHKAESNLYMKAVRATLILVPLLGIEFVLFPWRPEGRIAEEVYDYVMHILMHYQVGSSTQPCSPGPRAAGMAIIVKRNDRAISVFKDLHPVVFDFSICLLNFHLIAFPFSKELNIMAERWPYIFSDLVLEIIYHI